MRAGGFASTAGDIAKWVDMVLTDGEVDGAEFIEPGVLHRPTPPMRSRAGTPKT